MENSGVGWEEEAEEERESWMGQREGERGRAVGLGAKWEVCESL